MTEFWNSTNHKARKSHTCLYCGKTISPGETYWRERGMCDGDFQSYCLCERCKTIIPYFCLDEYIGDFIDDLQEMDMLNCPECGHWNSRWWEMASDKMSIEIQCDSCDHTYTVDLSEEALLKRFNNKKE